MGPFSGLFTPLLSIQYLCFHSLTIPEPDTPNSGQDPKEGVIKCYVSGKNDRLPTSRFVHIADSGRRVVGVDRGDGVTPVSVAINVTIEWVSLILWIFTFFLSCHT